MSIHKAGISGVGFAGCPRNVFAPAVFFLSRTDVHLLRMIFPLLLLFFLSLVLHESVVFSILKGYYDE